MVSIVVYERGKDARFLLVSGGSERATSRILNFSNFWKNEKAMEVLNSSPKGYFC